MTVPEFGVPDYVRLARHEADLSDAGHEVIELSVTNETDTTLRLAPDGAGGVEFAATAGSSDAVDVDIADAGGYFTATDVEAALQELAKKDIGYTAHGNTGSTETFDALTGWHSATLNANCTFTFTGATSGLVATMILELLQDGTGSRLVTWPGSVVWPGGVAPTLSTTAGATDILLFESRNGGSTWYGFLAGGGSGSGSTLTVKDEGTPLATAATSLDFVGTDISASGTGAAKTITITGSFAATQAAAEATAAAALAAHVASGGGGASEHAHVVEETHLSDGSTVTWTLDQNYEPGSVIAWNTTTLARLLVTEVLPDKATVSAAGTTSDKIVFDYAATLA